MDAVSLPDGTSLSVTITGEGVPLVLCHGGPGLWDYLGPLARLLDDTAQVIRYDQRGCGRSTGTAGPFTVEQFVDDLEQLRRALDIKRWWVGGHSWGAQLALLYGLAHPSTTQGVLYISGTGLGTGYRTSYQAERERRLGPKLARWQELSERPRTEQDEHEWCVLQWAPDYSPSVDGVALAEADWASRDTGVTVNHRCNREVWHDQLAATDDTRAALSGLEPPLLVVHGSDDPRPFAATDELLAACPHASRHVLPGAGHFPWVERPEEVRGVMVEFLRGTSEPPDALGGA